MRIQAAVFVTLLAATLGGIGAPAAPPPQASEAVAPLLFVTLQGPDASSVTVLETAKTRKTLDAPLTLGLRPGNVYRFRFDGKNLRDPRRGAEVKPEPIYASLEVGGTLRLPPKIKADDFAAPVALTDDDLERIYADGVVTKVILVEDPDKADAKRQPGDKIVEMNLPVNENLFPFAKTLGRPLAILRLGRREPDADQLACQRTGNVLYPGETTLPPVARDPTCFPIDMRPYFRSPEECLRDGGDGGQPAFLDFGGKLEGLDPSDTIAEYHNAQGLKRIAISNRVCICVPRFLAVKQNTPLAVYDGIREPAKTQGREIPEKLRDKQRLEANRGIEDAETLRKRSKLAGTVGVQGPGTLSGLEELRGVLIDLGPAELLGTEQIVKLEENQRILLKRQVEFALRTTGSVALKGTDGTLKGPVAIGLMEGLGQIQGSVETKTIVYICKDGEKPELPEQPLQILKWCSTDSAKIGDVVTYFVRYSNCGGKPISHIAISDSLTARLEYIPGTAKSDREAVFITQVNEAESLILKWEIVEPLPPGQRGVVSFQARIK